MSVVLDFQQARVRRRFGDVHVCACGAGWWTVAVSLTTDGVITGNTVVDALLAVKRKQRPGSAGKSWKEYFRRSWDLAVPGKTSDKKLILGGNWRNLERMVKT